MLRLGIDIDGTVTSTETFVPYLNQSFDLNITLDDITQYDLTSLLKISQEDFWKWMDENEPAIYKEAPLAPFAKEVLNNWKETHHLIYITARRKHLEELSLSWFKENELFYHQVDLVGSHHKIEAAKNHNVQVFFEDKHDNAVMIAEELQIPVILFDAPYNREPIPSNVIRVSNWLEAKKWVDHHWQQTSKNVLSRSF